jgi:hypothetical protein
MFPAVKQSATSVPHTVLCEASLVALFVDSSLRGLVIADDGPCLSEDSQIEGTALSGNRWRSFFSGLLFFALLDDCSVPVLMPGSEHGSNCDSRRANHPYVQTDAADDENDSQDWHEACKAAAC